MSHLLVLTAGTFSLYLAYRWVRREYQRVETSFRRTERRIKQKSRFSSTPLVFDPDTGLYVPPK